jgi:hypothetical protein
VWLIVLSDQLPIVALVGSYPTNQLIGHRPIPKRLTLTSETLLSPLHQKEPMRACRRFLAGIPHFRPGHPCVTHPSATPSRSEKQKDVRLACVRHAASVYPEPGSNSPSGSMSPPARSRAYSWSCPRYLSRDPGQAVAVLVVPFALGCSQIHACTLSRAQASFLTGTVVDACASLQLLFCFPLFNCQSTTGSKSCSLLCHLLETDKRTQEQIHFKK